jgi:hypothetical protein
MPVETQTLTRVLLDSLVPQALLAATHSDRNSVIVTSPYLTGDTIHDVIGALPPSSTTILTTFRAETFASRGSSLAVLRTLIDRGFQLRHLNNLHAKIILDTNTCFVGSQNLTLGGLQNKEATAIISDAAVVAETRERLGSWIASSSLITTQMIDEMEKLIEPLATQLHELSAALSELDTKIATNETARQLRERQRLAEAEQVERQREQDALIQRARHAHARLRSRVRSSKSSTVVRLSRQQVVNSSWDTHTTLLAPPDSDLTSWWLNDEHVSLTKRERYLLIVPETGKLGWPALNKTRLTRFGTGLTPSNMIVRSSTRSWKVAEIRLNQNLRTLSEWNVLFGLEANSVRSDLLMKFDLDGLQLVEIKQKKSGHLANQLRSDLGSIEPRLGRQLRKALSESFRYKSNGLGVGVDTFCSGMSRSLLLSLKSYAGHTFFCLQGR